MTKVPVSWRKSSYSAQQTDCVEVADTLAAVRDSKNPGVQVSIRRAAWAVFIAAVRTSSG